MSSIDNDRSYTDAQIGPMDARRRSWLFRTMRMMAALDRAIGVAPEGDEIAAAAADLRQAIEDGMRLMYEEHPW